MRKRRFGFCLGCRKLLVFLSAFLVSWFCLAGIASAQEGKLKFSDVPESSGFWPYINYLTTKDVISGFPDGTFRPDGSLTRAQVAKLLVRALGLKESVSPQPHFKDVAQSHWVYNIIETAAEAGLLKGYPDGTFRPGQAVTRAEATALLLRLSSAPLPQIDLPKLDDLPPAHWASRPVGTALDIGLIGLAAKNSFAPDKPCTRGEMVRGLALMMVLSPDLRATPLVGKLLVKKGRVQLTSPGSKEPSSVSDQVYLKEGDAIKVDQDALAEIVFEDGSGIKIEPGTELTVNKLNGFAYLSSDGTAKSAVDLLEITLKRGKIFGALASSYVLKKEVAEKKQTAWHGPGDFGFAGESIGNRVPEDQKCVLLAYEGEGLDPVAVLLAQVSRVSQDKSDTKLPWWKTQYAKRTRVKVNMPWGVAGIQGSFWMNWVTPEGKEITTVLVGEAVVVLAGQTAVIFDGQSLRVTDPQAPLPKPLPMTREELKEWVEAKQWVEERAQEIQKQVERNISTEPKLQLEGKPPATEIMPERIADVINEVIEKAEVEEVSKAPAIGGGGGAPPTAIPELVFQPETGQVKVGDTFTVDLVARNIQDLYGVDVEFWFNPTGLEVIAVEPGAEWKGTKGFAENKYDNKEGKVALVMTRKSPYAGCSGVIVLATIKFKVLSVGSYPLLLSPTRHDLSNSVPGLITHQARDGSVEVITGE